MGLVTPDGIRGSWDALLANKSPLDKALRRDGRLFRTKAAIRSPAITAGIRLSLAATLAPVARLDKHQVVLSFWSSAQSS